MSNQQKTETSKTKVITGITRLSYANLNQAKSINGGDARYSASVLIPKSDTKTLNAIKAAVQSAYDEGQAKLKGTSKSVPALSVAAVIPPMFLIVFVLKLLPMML